MILGNYLLELYGVSAQFDLRVFDESFDTAGFDTIGSVIFKLR
jgi:hypothetical protein